MTRLIDALLVTGEPADKDDIKDYAEENIERYVLSITWNGTLEANQVLLRHKFERAVTFPIGLALSQATAEDDPTSNTTISVQKNGVEVGTIVFEAGSPTSALFTMASATSYAQGDVLRVIGPASPDATLGDLGLTLVAAKA